MKSFLLSLSFLFYAQSQLLEYDIKPDTVKSAGFMRINFLDSKELKFDDTRLSELSALAYKEDRLYALSDLGYLCSFNIVISGNTIDALELIDVNQLRSKNGDTLKKSRSDSEGMVLVDEMLYISFEREPRVDVFSLNGKKIKRYRIDKELRDIDNYQGKNKALESVAYSHSYGVVTAPELPLRYRDKKYHTLYANDKTWKFKAAASLTAMEFIDDDKLLTLERDFDKSSNQTVVTLTKVFLDECLSGVCRSEILAVLDSQKGWRVDNFEGLAKVGKNRFLMVSDNNGSLFQKTLLVLFEIVDD